MGEKILIPLNITAEKYHAYYAGSAKSVVGTAVDGRKIQFPANVLQRFLTHDGIYGLFELEIDSNHKFIGIKQVSVKN